MLFIFFQRITNWAISSAKNGKIAFFTDFSLPLSRFESVDSAGKSTSGNNRSNEYPVKKHICKQIAEKCKQTAEKCKQTCISWTIFNIIAHCRL